MHPSEPANSFNCPECESSFIEYLKDAQTGDIVRPDDRRLFVCMICRHIFPVFADESPSIMRDAVGTAIEGDRKCPSCGYNLRTLKIGARCPECGVGIKPAAELRMPHDGYRWTGWHSAMAILIGAGLLALWRFRNHSPNRDTASLFLALVASVLILRGSGGLATGRIGVGGGFVRRTATGREGVINSLLSIFLGILAAMLAAVGYFRWF
ncbi:MAG: hypothetical protein HZA51_01835 [Planctomycetes bacterium]|nr:hypothetical protein [Planctomycetota bacterium]